MLVTVAIIAAHIFACKPAKPFSYVQISGEIILDTNDQKLVFAEPFKPVKQVHRVCFEYSDPLQIEYVDKPPTFPDGKPLLITARLNEQTGRIIELNDISRNGPNYLCFTPKEFDWWLSIYKTDITFTALTVQSNRRIKISKIKWESFNAWDLK